MRRTLENLGRFFKVGEITSEDTTGLEQVLVCRVQVRKQCFVEQSGSSVQVSGAVVVN